MSRKITDESVEAFLNATPFKKANMQIEVLSNVTVMYLHGNAIAYLYNDPKKTLSITTCGWSSNTTKERLNALPNVSIYQKRGQLYLNDIKWDGKLVDVL